MSQEVGRATERSRSHEEPEAARGRGLGRLGFLWSSRFIRSGFLGQQRQGSAAVAGSRWRHPRLDAAVQRPIEATILLKARLGVIFIAAIVVPPL